MLTPRITGTGGRLFADPTPSPDETTFQVDSTEELTRLKPESEAGTRAVLLAVHHPPASADAAHAGTTGLAQDIDACAEKAGMWPDVVLSGHAHTLTASYHLSGSAQAADTVTVNLTTHTVS
jgi:hypothetical protein